MVSCFFHGFVLFCHYRQPSLGNLYLSPSTTIDHKSVLSTAPRKKSMSFLPLSRRPSSRSPGPVSWGGWATRADSAPSPGEAPGCAATRGSRAVSWCPEGHSRPWPGPRSDGQGGGRAGRETCWISEKPVSRVRLIPRRTPGSPDRSPGPAEAGPETAILREAPASPLLRA